MARYRVLHRYSSSAYGPWVVDDHVELDPEQAAWVNHDSPGTLEEVDPQKQADAKRAAKEEADRREKALRESSERRESAERVHGVSQSGEPGRMDPGASQDDESGREPGAGQGEPAVDEPEPEDASTVTRKASVRRTGRGSK